MNNKIEVNYNTYANKNKYYLNLYKTILYNHHYCLLIDVPSYNLKIIKHELINKHTKNCIVIKHTLLNLIFKYLLFKNNSNNDNINNKNQLTAVSGNILLIYENNVDTLLQIYNNIKIKQNVFFISFIYKKHNYIQFLHNNNNFLFKLLITDTENSKFLYKRFLSICLNKNKKLLQILNKNILIKKCLH